MLEFSSGKRHMTYNYCSQWSISLRLPCVVNIPSFMVRIDSQKLIDLSITSPFRGGCPIQVKRKNQKAAAKKAYDKDADEEDEE
ncbi:hypothetical protein G4B88_027943 [Cannabis sativa]|uniref:Uncharacterized protein n=1 Tax=Cannabis sativa TaxID=3483 RepID=A0A7J6I6E6_CANSA|nr:hypothetical protein G4B88_027943 [Cannabis sativa]